MGPDLNPVDYKVWSVMQEKVYKKWIEDFGELRAHILTAWDKMDQRITGIDKAVRQWHTRLHACIRAILSLNTHCVSNVFLPIEQY